MKPKSHPEFLMIIDLEAISGWNPANLITFDAHFSKKPEKESNDKTMF